ncbi:MAG: hypothetical protein LBT23_07615 [Synergistaceae bacterium]|jgi:hypothetical protein|nr:hypothetical protein [Synergistaceae bacterium]
MVSIFFSILLCFVFLLVLILAFGVVTPAIIKFAKVLICVAVALLLLVALTSALGTRNEEQKSAPEAVVRVDGDLSVDLN